MQTSFGDLRLTGCSIEDLKDFFASVRNAASLHCKLRFISVDHVNLDGDVVSFQSDCFISAWDVSAPSSEEG